MVRRRELPKYCSYNVDRHGKRRVRFRKAGFSTYLPGTPWGEKFMKAYAAALDGTKVARGEAGASRTRRGSISALIVHYYRSSEFTGLKPSTQTTYRGILDRFRKEHGRRLVKDLRPKHLYAIFGKMDDRKTAANNLRSLLILILDFAIKLDWIETNAARVTKPFKVKTSGFHSWTEDEIAQFAATHPIGSKAHLAMALMLYTGQRRSDAVRMGWQHVTSEGRLRVTQQKTGRRLEIKMHPTLVQAISAQPKDNMTFLVTEYGAPFSAAGFGNWMRKRCNEAGLRQCSSHGLRKAATRRLFDAGNPLQVIAAITGHQSLKELERYGRDYDQRKLADAGIDSLSSGTESEQKLSNLEDGLDKTGTK